MKRPRPSRPAAASGHRAGGGGPAAPLFVWWTAAAVVLILVLGSAWWGSRRLRLALTPEPGEAVDATERSLREAARQRPRDPTATQALGSYYMANARQYEAMWAFQDELDLQSGSVEASLELARALIQVQLPRLSLASLASPAGTEAPGPGTPAGIEERRVAARAYLAMGDALGAVAVLTSAGERLKQSAPALLELGQAYEALGDDARAVAAYQLLIQLPEGGVEGRLGLGRTSIRQRRWEEARTALEEARRAARADPRPLVEMVRLVEARGGPAARSTGEEGALGFFRRALSLRPDDGPALREAGLWFLRQGKTSAAAVSLDLAVARGAGGAETRLRLAEAWDRSGRAVQACYQRGTAYLETQQPRRAVPEFERMDALDPHRPEALLLLIGAFTKANENGKAAEVARRGLERFPDEPRLLARRAALLLMTDERQAGADLCGRWQQRFPNAAEPYRLLASLARDAGRSAEAVRLCEQALARDPQNAEYHREAARALMAAPTPDSLRRAADHLRRAAALNPKDAAAPLQLGDVLERLGDREGALREYQRAMDRDPSDRRGPVALVQLCPRLGKQNRTGFYGHIARTLREREASARSLWRQAFLSPDDPEPHSGLAGLLMEAGDLAQARYQLQQFLALRPGRKEETHRLRALERLLEQQEE
jgi:tetratricopeptide (TPR) repeat protein